MKHPALGLWLDIDWDHVAHGLWCRDCRLPSGVSYPIIAWPLGTTEPPFSWGRPIVRCVDCGGDDIEEAA